MSFGLEVFTFCISTFSSQELGIACVNSSAKVKTWWTGTWMMSCMVWRFVQPTKHMEGSTKLLVMYYCSAVVFYCYLQVYR